MSFYEYDLGTMVPKSHAFRKFKDWLPVDQVCADIKELAKI